MNDEHIKRLSGDERGELEAYRKVERQWFRDMSLGLKLLVVGAVSLTASVGLRMMLDGGGPDYERSPLWDYWLVASFAIIGVGGGVMRAGNTSVLLHNLWGSKGDRPKKRP